MKYIEKRRGFIFFILGIMVLYNGYFLLLLKEQEVYDLIYVDILMMVVLAFILLSDVMLYHKAVKYKQNMLESEHLIYMHFNKVIDMDIIEHDIAILEEQHHEQYMMNCDLQDYMAKWVHEIKIPLSISILMNDKIQDINLRTEQRIQLERMNQLLNAALVCCKVQGKVFDLQIKRINLSDCIRNAIHNNQFFLIRNHFQMDIQYKELYVFSDSQWLVYVFDQLLSNAIKYTNKDALLKVYMKHRETAIQLMIEDYGEGIKKKDIKRIFDKGFTGDNHHNGKYKSTGMGLYMVAQIINKLGHDISVESEYGEFTRFTITFYDNHKHFNF